MAQAVTANGNITLTSQDGTGTTDNITLPDGSHITAANGSVALQAGDDVHTSPSSIIVAESTLTITGDYGDVDGLGSTIDLSGSLIVPTLLVIGSAHNDNIAIDAVREAGTFTTVLGGGGSDRIVASILGSPSASVTIYGDNSPTITLGTPGNDYIDARGFNRRADHQHRLG